MVTTQKLMVIMKKLMVTRMLKIRNIQTPRKINIQKNLRIRLIRKVLMVVTVATMSQTL